MRDPRTITTLQQHFVNTERQFPSATGELTNLLWDLTLAIKTINHEVRRAGLTDIHGAVGTRNVHGDVQQKLDVYADTVMTELLRRSGHVCIMGSEEQEEPIRVPDAPATAKYVVLFDPLDGSSNFDVNASIGTIFSVYRKTSAGPATVKDLLRSGNEQVAAGYALYGSSTMVVYTTGNGVHGFTYDPDIGEFLLSHEDIRMPARGKYYAVNQAHFRDFDAGTQAYLTEIMHTPKETRLSLRNIGCLVADMHRVLLKGGIFLYPALHHGKTPDAKLRLLYEVAPFSWIVEQAGGSATTGTTRAIERTATSLHERCPIIMGSPENVADYQQHLTT